jgi:phage terminase large subunit-like protein
MSKTSKSSTQFRKTDRQKQAIRLLNQHQHSLLYGGGRSGKTFAIDRQIILRAVAKKSRHLMVRLHFNHARSSLEHETVPDVIQQCFPDVGIIQNKTDYFWNVPTVDGQVSEVWLGGTSDKERIDKILGRQFSTIYASECSEIPFDAITTMWTRLAENSGLPLRFFYDENPPGKKHWSHQLFMEGLLPGEGRPHGLDTAHLQMNPIHNQDNLPPAYLKMLEALPLRKRQRFLEGLFLSDIEGALWKDEMINRARARLPGEVMRTVVSVDPSTTNNPGSDECGIVVVGKESKEEGAVLADLSAKLSTRAWAERAVSAYHLFGANEIVAETNQGGNLVVDAIHNVDPHVRVVKVHAAVGKMARAEPVAQLYEMGRIRHADSFPHLETEMVEWVPSESKWSPNRVDALVHGLTHLLVKPGPPRLFFR